MTKTVSSAKAPPSGRARKPRPVAKPYTGAAAPVIRCEATLATAYQMLRTRDPALIDRLVGAAGPPPLRLREPGFAGLAWIVVSQQVSTASAKAIHGRLAERFPDFTTRNLLAADDEALKSCGLSAPKIRTLRAAAQAIVSGAMDAASAHATMTSIHGIGPWTADIYLLFCLGHPDAWPIGDLALQEAARMALGLKTRPDAKELDIIGERWRPARGVAARILWAWYGVEKAAGR